MWAGVSGHVVMWSCGHVRVVMCRGHEAVMWSCVVVMWSCDHVGCEFTRVGLGAVAG